jgi:hypothetical protein
MDFKKLDTVFSEYIRRRDAVDGFVKCCTCPTVLHWKEMDCGHWMKRGNMGTRFDESNCHPQCKICNQHEDGRDIKHMQYIKERHGLNERNRLVMIAHREKHWMQYEIDELTEYYKAKLKDLATMNS